MRFVTFSCHRRLPLLGHPAIRDLLAAELSATRQTYRFELFAWVVMPEHVHILLRPREGALTEVLRGLKTSVAKQVVARWRQLQAPILAEILTSAGTSRFWQKGGGFDRNVRNLSEFCREVRYVHHNPVERGLAAAPQDWKWSSARWWMGERSGTVECDPPPGDPRMWANWKGYR